MPDVKKVAKKLISVIKDGDALKFRYYMVKYSVDIVRIKTSPSRQNLLHVACKYLAKDVVEFLMNKRRLLTKEDRKGRLPVHILIEKLSSASSRKRALFADVLSRMQRESVNLFPSFEAPFFQFNSFFENISPSFANMFPSMSPTFNAFRTTAFQRLDFCQQFDPRRDSDETWASKLTEEMQAEQNEEWGRCACENDEPRQETFDERASRISSEYQRKHGHHSSSSTSHQHSRNYFTTNHDQQKKFEEAERELQRLRNEKLKRKEKKNYVTQKKAYEMVCHRIKSAPDEAQQSIIKPSRLPELVVQPSAQNIRNVFFCDIKESNEKRKYVKEQMKVWHPDKFLHKVRNCVAEKHVSEIEEIATRFCQFLTELLADIE